MPGPRSNVPNIDTAVGQRPATLLDWGAVAVTKAPGFSEAGSIVEFGAGDFSRSLALAERYPAKQFLSTDFKFGDDAQANVPRIESIPNLDVAAIDVRTVDLPADSVDFVFSIALMEHVAQLDECLEAVHRALRPGGVYFYIQAPFWSCAQGHHFKHSDDRTYDFIPKYSHLTSDRSQFADLLRGGPVPPFDIETCVDSIYARPDLSRLGLYKTRAIVESGPLEVVSWKQTPDRRYDEERATAAFAKLRAPLAFEELAVSGAEVLLRKTPTARWRSMLGRVRRSSRAGRLRE